MTAVLAALTLLIMVTESLTTIVHTMRAPASVDPGDTQR